MSYPPTDVAVVKLTVTSVATDAHRNLVLVFPSTALATPVGDEGHAVLALMCVTELPAALLSAGQNGAIDVPHAPFILQKSSAGNSLQRWMLRQASRPPQQ